MSNTIGTGNVNNLQDEIKKYLDTDEKGDVAEPCEAYEDFLEYLELIEVLYGGTKKIREYCIAGQTTNDGSINNYLPQEKAESDQEYKKRVARSTLLSIYKRTIEKMTGEVFKTPMGFNDATPENVMLIEEDIDNSGKDLTRFCQSVFWEALAKGVTHVLVDYPVVNKRENNGVLEYFNSDTQKWERYTKQVQKELQHRPYWIQIHPKQVIDCKYRKENGIKKLVQVRIKEVIKVDEGRFKTKEVEQIRVLEPGLWEVWQQVKVGDKLVWAVVESGATSVNFVPFVTIMFGDPISEITCIPPLEGLAYLNLAHFQSSSDQRNILHYARLVTYFGKMIGSANEDTTEIIIGGNVLLHSEHPEGDLKVVEHSGKAIESGRQDILDLERQMALFGLTFLMPRTGNVTATERAINSSENDSPLMSCVKKFKDSIELLMEYTGQMLGNSFGENGFVDWDVSLSNLMNVEILKVLLDAFEKNLLPKKVLIEEFRRRGVIHEDWEVIDVMRLLDKEYSASLSFDSNDNNEKDVDEEEEEF